jgi:hypothetical protein
VRRADWVTYRNGKSITSWVGRPPKRIPAIDVIGLQLRNSRRRKDFYIVYMTPDEAADHIRVLSIALAKVAGPFRWAFARHARLAKAWRPER